MEGPVVAAGLGPGWEHRLPDDVEIPRLLRDLEELPLFAGVETSLPLDMVLGSFDAVSCRCFLVWPSHQCPAIGLEKRDRILERDGRSLDRSLEETAGDAETRPEEK